MKQLDRQLIEAIVALQAARDTIGDAEDKTPAGHQALAELVLGIRFGRNAQTAVRMAFDSDAAGPDMPEYHALVLARQAAAKRYAKQAIKNADSLLLLMQQSYGVTHTGFGDE